ncbi:MAG: nucleotidyltransferase family protein [Leptolyngbyaceae cyanobacterium CSU_1_4]|nr:nucleotidyltransferase family protein [Leptolyngbyaceae cyanobacterium CSU_1_4]
MNTLPSSLRQPETSIRPENELMFCCTRVQVEPPTVKRIHALVQQNLDWQAVIQLAYRHGVMPLLYKNLYTICPEAIPEPDFEQLRHLFKTNTQRSLLLAGELVKILTLFNQHEIAAVPYKGPVLAHAVYGGVAFRQYFDLDIVVQQQDVLPAKRLLMEQGYIPKDGMNELEEAAFLQSRDEHNYTLIHTDKRIAVELHWRITPRSTSVIEPKHFWERLEPDLFAGTRIANLSLEEWLPILCVHGSRHRWERLTWLCDIAEIMRLRPNLDWDAVIARSQILVCQRMLFLGVLLAHRLLDAPLPIAILQKMQAHSEVLTLVNRTYQQLLYETKVSDQFLGKTIYQIRVSDRFQEKALYLQSFLQWLINSDKKIVHH